MKNLVTPGDKCENCGSALGEAVNGRIICHYCGSTYNSETAAHAGEANISSSAAIDGNTKNGDDTPNPISEKISASVKIAFAAFATSILGFMAQTSGYLHGVVVSRISEAFYSVNLQWFSGHSINDVVRVNQLLYLMLLLGAVLYVISKQKETRLIRFFFLLVFMSRIISVFMATTAKLFMHDDPYGLNDTSLLSDIYYYVVQAAWLWLSFIILRYFNRNKAVESSEIEYETIIYTDYTFASLWQRIFHLVTDLLIGAMLFYWVIDILLRMPGFFSGLRSLQEVLGPRSVALAFAIFLRLVYYMLTEAIFGTTPAKLLTETRVINAYGVRPDAGTIIGRTFCRFVPFEAFSFFGAQGWHDKWSGTMVVREIRTGVKGAYYFYVIPAVLVLLFVFSYTSDMVRAHNIKSANERTITLRRDKMDRMLASLTTNDVLDVGTKNSNYGDVTSYLKVEKIDGDNITISKITPPHNHIINQLYVEELYKKDKDSLERFTISRAQIKKAFNVEREPYSVDEVPLKINYGNYYVRDIETFFSTNIKLSGADSWGPEVKVGLVNTGHPGELSEIKVIDGDVDITSPASKHLYAAPRERNGYNFDIAGKSSSPFGDFKISFTVTDSLGHRQVYQIGGSFRYNRDYNERTIERISP